MSGVLGESKEPLQAAYDLAMLDLDGVVYVGGEAVRGAPEALDVARKAGMRLAFVTNNAARTPETVAAHLVDLGIEAEAHDVVTSAQAAARVLVDRLGRGARVVVLGAEGLRTALESERLVPVGVGDGAAAIVSGYAPDLPWRDVMRGAVRIADGLPWVASNTDMTIPTDYGTAPGHGVLVDLLRRFTGVDPTVAGKPARPLLDETIRRVGGERPLMVGDRLDTDIEGAQNADVPSLLVLTGVTGLAELVAARPAERPTYVAADLAGLAESHPAPRTDGSRAELGGWSADVVEGRLEVGGHGAPNDWWRVVAASGWAHLDASGTPADITALRPPDGSLGA